MRRTIACLLLAATVAGCAPQREERDEAPPPVVPAIPDIY